MKKTLERGLRCSLLLACQAATAQQLAINDLLDLSLEQLRDVRVTSVARRPQALLEAAASVYVIGGDEIRRSGVQTLPEALRLAPNLEVAALDARQYAVTARGFNTNIANKLLVLVDGRTIYSPLFSGTFWDAQDFVPADIDRIEVISGPAGATWGTNAVNGVINIVTRPAAETQGVSASLTGGNLARQVTARHGFSPAPGVALRLHADAFHRAATQLRSGGDNHDAVDGQAAGLRMDWSEGRDAVMLQAGVYRNETDPRPVYGEVQLWGAHLLGRWSRSLGDGADVDLQAYADETRRKDLYLLQDRGRLFDVEGKLHYRWGEHRLLLGAGYRRNTDTADPGLLFAFLPPHRRLSWYSVFAQDEYALSERLSATLGTRFERNPYSGWESLPSVHLGYKATDLLMLWGAVSRAVRSPARLDREIYTPPRPPFIVAGGPNFDSEIAHVAEVGARHQAASDLTWAATLFVHHYDRLRSAQVANGQVLIDNKIAGQIRGLEAWSEWSARPDWRLRAGLLWQEHRLHLKAGSNDPVGPSNLGNDPRLQWSLRSVHAVTPHLDAELALRHVGELPRPVVAAYTATDLTLNWRPTQQTQLTLGVRNAFDPQHVEYDSGIYTGTIPRSAFVTLTYQP